MKLKTTPRSSQAPSEHGDDGDGGLITTGRHGFGPERCKQMELTTSHCAASFKVQPMQDFLKITIKRTKKLKKIKRITGKMFKCLLQLKIYFKSITVYVKQKKSHL